MKTMNNIKKLPLMLMLGVAFLFTSCEKGLLEGVNDNPNQPEEVSSGLLLPSGQAYLAYGIGGDISRYTSMLTQQVVGTGRQWATYQRYQITETETDNWWRFNHYGGALMDLHLMINQAEAVGDNQYAGIGKILMAYGIMVVSDLVGDVPYSQAFQGAENLTPGYDTQAELYPQLVGLLTEGITNINDAAGPNTPGADDLIYGGTIASWEAFGNVLLARSYIHLGNVDAANYTNALNTLDNNPVFTSNADDAEYVFGAATTEAAPWSQFNGQRGDISFISDASQSIEVTMYDTLLALGDPRWAVYYDTAAVSMGAYFGASTSSFVFASYAEQKFIEAEAAFQSGNTTRAQTAFEDGVRASLEKYGVFDQTYFDAATDPNTTLTLDRIMFQKWLASFTNPESFTDWRRTGSPALTPVAGNVTNNTIPRRLPYPLTERLYNGANRPSDNSILSRVWWDQ